MKKLILSLFVVLLGATSAMGQISFYGEWRRKISNELVRKVWHTPDFARVESVDDKGNKSVSIMDMKAKKVYHLNEANKTCMVLENIDNLTTNQIIGYDWEVSSNTSREFKGMEEIDGKECAHYLVKTESMNKTGGKDGTSYNEWIYEPMKASNYDGCIATDNNIFFKDKIEVLRNVKMGAQPAHLFKVPEGYTTNVVPAGGLIEMITGKSREENTKNIDNKADALKEMFNSINKKANAPNKSDEDKMKALIEMMGGGKKK